MFNSQFIYGSLFRLYHERIADITFRLYHEGLANITFRLYHEGLANIAFCFITKD